MQKNRCKKRHASCKTGVRSSMLHTKGRCTVKKSRIIFTNIVIMAAILAFVVFYNGTDKEADRRIMRMSDAFSGEIKDNASLECTALVLNINHGHNKEIMQKCKKLDGYSSFIYKIRQNVKTGMTLGDAVDKAVDDCIKEDILVDILVKHRAEAKTMILEEFDLEFHINNEKAISFEDGLEKGRAEGREERQKLEAENKRLLEELSKYKKL